VYRRQQAGGDVIKATHIVNKGAYGVLDVFGPIVEFLTSPDEPDAIYCVLIGTIPPGVSVPLHSHADVESFYVLSGSVQALTERGDSFEWLNVKSGDFIHVPGNAKHAFRNIGSEPVVELITTTPKIGKFFQEIGRPVTPGVPAAPPTADEIAHFLQVAARYHYWNGSPQENAAIGISLFE
jgi:quercetin dioxygenase-like cupin family protein